MNVESTPGLLSPERIFSFIREYRKLLFFAGLTWFALLVGGGITLSTLDARSGLHIFGSKVWLPGQPSVIRVALKDLTLRRNHAMEWVKIRFVDTDGRSTPEQMLEQSVGDFKQGPVVAPSRPGAWRVELEAQGPKQIHQAEFLIDVQTSYATHRFPKPPKAKPPMQPDTGTLRLDIRPIGGVLAAGLPGELAIIAHDATGPVATSVRLGLESGRSKPPLPLSISTDANGIAIIDIHPMHPLFTFHLKAGDSRAIRQIEHATTQFIVETPHPIITAGPVPFVIESLHRNADIFLDLWRGDHWVDSIGVTLNKGRGEARLDIPHVNGRNEWLWIQAYKDTYNPEGARGGCRLLATQDDRNGAFRWGASQILGAGYGKDNLLGVPDHRANYTPQIAKLYFGLPTWPERSPPLLMNSSVTARQTVTALKSKWQTRFVRAFVVTGLFLFLVLGTLLWRNQAQVRHGWVEHGGMETGVQGNRGRFFLDVGYIFLVLAGFLFGIIQLLLSIHW